MERAGVGGSVAQAHVALSRIREVLLSVDATMHNLVMYQMKR